MASRLAGAWRRPDRCGSTTPGCSGWRRAAAASACSTCARRSVQLLGPVGGGRRVDTGSGVGVRRLEGRAVGRIARAAAPLGREGRETALSYTIPADRDSISPDLVRDIVGRRATAAMWMANAQRARSARSAHRPLRALSHTIRRIRSRLSSNRVNAVLVDRSRAGVGRHAGRAQPARSGVDAFERFRAGEQGLSDDFVRVLLEDRSGDALARHRGRRRVPVARGGRAIRLFPAAASARRTLSDDRVFSLLRERERTRSGSAPTTV